MASRRLFPTDLPAREWLEFEAQGFPEPVAGLIYRASNPALCGMPLGGVDTGCIDLETDGTFGYCSIFNSHVPRRGPMNLPFLGLALRKDLKLPWPGDSWESWVLSTRRVSGNTMGSAWAMALEQTRSAREIHYWGHYPVADLEFDLDAPVTVSLRAWSPFIPGDVGTSNTPGAVFEVRLRNTSDSTQKGALAFSFPGPSPQEAYGDCDFTHAHVDGNFTGVDVYNGHGIGYALGVIGDENIRSGGDLGTDGGSWSRIGSELPVTASQPGAAIAVDFELATGGEKTVRFVLAWYSPEWEAAGRPMVDGDVYDNGWRVIKPGLTTSAGRKYSHMYASRYGGALEVARMLADQYESLLGRILAWQKVIYGEKDLPLWLRESLVNILHLVTEDGFWAQAKPPIPEWVRPEDGLFGMNESPRGCPQIECIPCSFYGNIPLVYFFPELALSTLRGYKGYQFDDGQMPWVFGGVTSDPQSPPCEMASPVRGYGERPQVALDGPCYVDMVERLWLRTQDQELLREFYPSVKKNTIFTMNLRPGSGAAGVVSMPKDNLGQDWFEGCHLYGIVPHIGGVHLAQLRMAERMASVVGDMDFAQQCRQWLQEGGKVMEENTWNGDYYLLYNEPETGKQCDVIMGYQLDGEWMAKSHGLAGVFREDRVRKTLETLEREVVCDRGAIVFKLTEESEFDTSYWTSSGIHLPGCLMLAMTYMYHGRNDLGLEIARRVMHTQICESGCGWDSILVLLGDSGKPHYGNDYYQNMMLWALPAALRGEDLSGPVKPEGLVDRVIRAATGKQ